MGFEIDLIKFLQRASSPFLDRLFYGITLLGTEFFFIFVLMIVYWCVDKREGYRLLNVFMISQIAVGCIKTLVRRPRPYNVEGVSAIMERTDGYSFPSGHSNNIAVVGTDIAAASRSKRTCVAFSMTAGVLIVLVMLSRMYLGQHYPSDVLTGALIGVGVGLLGYVLFDLTGDGEQKLMYAVIPLCIVILVAAIAFYVAKGEASESLFNIAGMYSASSIGYYLEKRFVRYEVRAAKSYNYVLRVLLGAATTIGLYLGFKALFGIFAIGIWELILVEFAVYFIVGIMITLALPAIFKKLRI